MILPGDDPPGDPPRGPVVKDAALASQRSKVRFLARAVENSQLVMNISKVEDRYEIMFHRSVWQEEPREIHVFEKSFEHLKPKIVNKNMKMGLNGVEVSPRGLIFDEDGATGCTTPPEALPTSFKAVSSQL